MKQQDFKDVYQRITDKIIEDLEKGTPPWIQPWRYEATESHKVKITDLGIWPRNAFSGNFYGGSNVLMCWAHMTSLGLSINEEPLFLTFKQAKMLGGHVKKGEKGCIVIGYRQGSKEVEDKEGDTKHITRSFAFGHTVFHLSQTENVTLKEKRSWKKKVSILPDLSHDKDWQAFVTATTAKIQHGGNRAVYFPLADEIHMPKAGQFKHADLYKAVLLHELTHWTGHHTRLSRKLNNPKGDAQYAEEELIAELGAAFMCARLGIVHGELRHASYIKSWLQVLKNDKKFIFAASRAAMRAVEFIEEIALKGMKAKKPVTKTTTKRAVQKARKSVRSMDQVSAVYE